MSQRKRKSRTTSGPQTSRGGFDHSTVRGHVKHFGLHSLYQMLFIGVFFIVKTVVRAVFEVLFEGGAKAAVVAAFA